MVLTVPAYAQQPQYSTASEYLGGASIIASATRLAQPVNEAPAAITIIDKDLIEALAYTDLVDLFRHVPGMTAAHFTGNKHSINYRGLRDLESRRMQVLVDGRSVYNPMFTGVDWDDIPIAIDDIERIEVIRSPNAATYGSNSFLAVVNIITTNPNDTLGTSIRVTGGNNGLAEGFVRHGFKIKDTTWRLRAGIRHQNELIDNESKPHDGRLVPFFNVSGLSELSSSDTLEFQGGFSGGTRDFGDANSFTQPPSKDSQRAGFIQARFRRILGPDHELQFHAFRNSRRQTREYLTRPLPIAGAPPPGLVLPILFDTRETRTEFEAQYTRPIGARTRIVAGLGVRRDSNRAPQIYNRDDSLTNTVYRIFGTGEWHLSNDLVVHAGAMLENNDFVGTEVSPRAAVNWKLNERHSVRASYSRGSRTPTFREENSLVVYTYQGILLDVQDDASGGLDSEKISAFEVGYLGESANGNLSWDVKVFHEKYDDLIAELRPRTLLDPPFADGRAFDWRNQDDATATGAEIQVDYRDTLNLLRITHSYADIDGTDRSERSLISNSGPRRSTTVFYQRKLSNDWVAGVSLIHMGKSTPLGSNLEADSYFRVDLRAGRTFRIGKRRGTIRATIENLFNEEIEDHKGTFFLGRRGYVSVRMDW